MVYIDYLQIKQVRFRHGSHSNRGGRVGLEPASYTATRFVAPRGNAEPLSYANRPSH